MKTKWFTLIGMMAILVAVSGWAQVASHSEVSLAAPMSLVEQTITQTHQIRPNRFSKPVRSKQVYFETVPDSNEAAVYIVQLIDAPLASYRGGVANLAATSPRQTGERKLKVDSANSRAYRAYLTDKRNKFKQTAEKILGHSLTIMRQYEVAYHGLAIKVTPQEAVKLLDIDGVKVIQREKLSQPLTDNGPAWIGAPAIWDGSATNGLPTKGEGMVVGILDTGINMEHPSFAARGPVDGYQHVNPRDKFYGVCDKESDQYDSSYTCNAKLIGVWNYLDSGPEDTDGHGSHTASTVAGNVLTNAVFVAPTTIITANISGVAPHANIIAYAVCDEYGCSDSAIVAGIEQAVIDEVEVINFSIGGWADDPWIDADAVAFLGATEAGIVNVASAGNDGPTAETISSPADAPWLLAVGAATHDRKFVNKLANLSGGDSPPPDLVGEGITAGYGPASLVYAGNYTSTLDELDPQCLQPFPRNTFHGEIVMCERGENPRLEKGENVKAGGAGGLVLINDEANGASLLSDGHDLPAVHLSYTDGLKLKEWLKVTNTVSTTLLYTATIAGTTVEVKAEYGDLLGSFSSRGPNGTVLDIIKPDMIAPGVNILAASTSDKDYEVMSGTSMASPHVAGAAVLLRVLHPDWSPAAIKSALMMTALNIPADPFSQGAGRVDISRAARAGFILEETHINFEAADPTEAGQPSSLNLPSLGNGTCLGSCTFTRTLSSTLNMPVAWTVATSAPLTMSINIYPISFTLLPQGVQEISVTVDVTRLPLKEWAFGEITFTPDNTATVASHFPVAIYPSVGELPTEVEIETRRNQGIYTIKDLKTISTTLEVHLYIAEPKLTYASVFTDPTPLKRYDFENGGVYSTTVNIMTGTKKFLIELIDSTASDLDLFVGFDSNGDGLPHEDEELCRSGEEDWHEICTFSDFWSSLEPGTYWILVQNFEGYGEDTFTLATTILDSSPNSESKSITIKPSKSSVAMNEPFDMEIAWQTPDLKAGDGCYGFIKLGQVGGQIGGIAEMSFSLVRLADDVALTTSAEFVMPGDIVTYTISLLPDPSRQGTKPTYDLVNRLPAGMSYVTGSATISPTVVDGQTLTWSALELAKPHYTMVTNKEDKNCKISYSGYVHLAEIGISPSPSISGNNVSFNLNEVHGSNLPFNFYGVDYPKGLYFTDNGLASLDEPTVDSSVNRDIPNADLPNNLMAPFWRDLEIVYDKENQRGVYLEEVFWDNLILEYRGVQVVGHPEQTFDFEILMYRQPFDYFPQIIFAYDNITGTAISATIGLENSDGSQGVKYAYNDAKIENGLAICFYNTDKTEISYQVRLDQNIAVSTTLTNTVRHTVPGGGTGLATQGLYLSGMKLQISGTSPATVQVGEPITYTYTITNQGVQTATNIQVVSDLPASTKYLSGADEVNEQVGVVTWTMPSLASNAVTQVVLIVKPLLPETNTMTSTITAAETRIIGGIEAKPGAWPWQVALMQADEEDGFDAQFCGGSLIDPNWIVTAAHCVYDGYGNVESPSAINVTVGRHTLSLTDGQRISVSQIIPHVNYTPDSRIPDFDIALLQLAKPAILTGAIGMTGAVKTIDLVTLADIALTAPDTFAIVTGWGDQMNGWGDYADSLNQVTVPLVSNQVCGEAYDKLDYPSGSITDNILCAGFYEGGKDACYGDSGGPLVVRDGHGGWKLAGIVSSGHECAMPEAYGTYTRVSRFTDWVEQAKHTYAINNYYVTDNTNLPGHYAAGDRAMVTIVGQYAQETSAVYLPLVVKQD